MDRLPLGVGPAADQVVEHPAQRREHDVRVRVAGHGPRELTAFLSERPDRIRGPAQSLGFVPGPEPRYEIERHRRRVRPERTPKIVEHRERIRGFLEPDPTADPWRRLRFPTTRGHPGLQETLCLREAGVDLIGARGTGAYDGAHFETQDGAG